LLVKAQGLIHAAQWLEQTHGREAVAEVLSRCSRPVNERYMSAIAIEWHPFEEFMEFLEQTEAVVGFGSGKTARDSGAYSAQQSTRGAVKRSLFYLSTPEFLMRRVTSLWSQYNDSGNMRLRDFTERKVVIELDGVPNPHRLLCQSLTGWVEVVAEAIGARGSKASHPACVLRGDDCCTFVIDWDARRGLEDPPPARRA
jgi:hypothetical protein